MDCYQDYWDNFKQCAEYWRELVYTGKKEQSLKLIQTLSNKYEFKLVYAIGYNGRNSESYDERLGHVELYISPMFNLDEKQHMEKLYNTRIDISYWSFIKYHPWRKGYNQMTKDIQYTADILTDRFIDLKIYLKKAHLNCKNNHQHITS